MLKLTCYSCEKGGHNSLVCPSVHYAPDPTAIIKAYLREGRIFNKTFKRRIGERYNARTQQDSTERSARRILVEKAKSVDKYFDFNLKSASQCLIPSIIGNDIIRKESMPGTITQLSFIENYSNNELQAPKSSRSQLTRIRTNGSSNKLLDSINSFKKKKFGGSLNILQKKESLASSIFRSQLFDSEDKDEIVFDALKNFPIYFPHNNIVKIIETTEQQLAKKNKLEEIKHQIEDLKVGVGRLLPSLLKIKSSGNLPRSYPKPTAAPKNKYWTLLFGDDEQDKHKNSIENKVQLAAQGVLSNLDLDKKDVQKSKYLAKNILSKNSAFTLQGFFSQDETSPKLSKMKGKLSDKEKPSK